jgi:hypothetical protein
LVRLASRVTGKEIAWRELALKIVTVLTGLRFTAAIYPAVAIVWAHDQSPSGDGTMMSVSFTLGFSCAGGLWHAVRSTQRLSSTGSILPASPTHIIDHRARSLSN